jgi:hypothetical protein
MATVRIQCLVFCLLMVAYCSSRAGAQPPSPGDAKPAARFEQRLKHLVVTPNGPEDGGDFGPKTPGTKTAGLQEAFLRAQQELRDVYVVGGGVNPPAGKGVVCRLDQTLHVPWMQDWRLDGGEYVLSYSGPQGDAVVIDSQMNCRLKFGLIVNEKSDGAMVRIGPTSKGPDGFCCCVASTFEFNGLVGAGDVWGRTADQKSTGLILDAARGGISGNKIFILEINACRRGVCLTPGSGNNTIEAQWIHLTNLGIQLGDAQAPAVSGNRITAGISGDLPRTTGVQIFGHHNTLSLDVFSADPQRALVLEGPAYDNLILAASLAGGYTNRATQPTNRLMAPFASDRVETPPMPPSGERAVNRSLCPVEVRILTPGKVSEWAEADVQGTVRTFRCGLASGQSFMLRPGERVQFSYEQAPTWFWKGL